MNHDQFDSLSRRNALQRGLGAITGVALVSVAFIAGKTAKDLGTCKIVEGKINPHGHCIAFSPKPKK